MQPPGLPGTEQPQKAPFIPRSYVLSCILSAYRSQLRAQEPSCSVSHHRALHSHHWNPERDERELLFSGRQ